MAGGSEADGAEDHGFVYARSFFGLDGHGRQVMWMDRRLRSRAPESFAACMQDADAPACVPRRAGAQRSVAVES